MKLIIAISWYRSDFDYSAIQKSAYLNRHWWTSLEHNGTLNLESPGVPGNKNKPAQSASEAGSITAQTAEPK